MNYLPKEIWTEIFLYENKHNFYTISNVCKDFYEMIHSITNQTNIYHIYENKELLKECYFYYPKYRCYFSHLLDKKRPEWIVEFKQLQLYISYYDSFKAIQNHNIDELEKYISYGCYCGPELYVESIKEKDIDIFHILYKKYKILMTKKIYKRIYKNPYYKKYQHYSFFECERICFSK